MVVRKDRFAWLLIVCFCVYLLMILYLTIQRRDVYVVYSNYFHLNRPGKMGEMVQETTSFPDDTEESSSSVESMDTETEDNYEFLFEVKSNFENVTFYGEEILTVGNISLKERMTCHFDKSERPRLILAPFDSGTLDGCPEWNCKLEHNFEKLHELDAIVTISSTARRRYDQYVVFFSQESPYHIVPYDDQQEFNMSLGFRHDSPVASPYGYTVKLAKRSRLTYSSLNIPLINGKTLGAAWFVSNCHTESGRENYVRELKKYYPVDVYGVCDGKLCPRDDPCEGMLNTDYHFYLSFENSICKDYITEKLWRHGYMHYVVPIVLKRSIVEPYVPPKSFIAADDFKSPKDLAKYLQYLMANKTAYLEYFIWRLDYHVVFLDGVRHTSLERPWGMCQLCRLLWEKPRRQYVIESKLFLWGHSAIVVTRDLYRRPTSSSNLDFTEYWHESCDDPVYERIMMPPYDRIIMP